MMEDKIKKTDKILSLVYMLFWVLPILIVMLGEFDILPIGINATDVRAVYYYEVAGILLTASLIPVSLKLFHWTLIKRIDKLSFLDALKRYTALSIIRLSLLAIVLIYNLIFYYLTMSTSCIFCACIGLVASLFCVPSDRRLREELHILNK